MALPSTVPVSVSALTPLLAQRLGISLGGADYWVQGELDYHVRNSIREFQVLTGYWRSRLNLVTAAGVPFYDLHAGSSPAIPRTVLDTDILAQVGYHLLEYAGTGNFINTGQFSINPVVAALAEQIDRILGETRMVVTDDEWESAPPPPDGRFALNSAILQVHRVEWQDAESELWTLLDRTDDIGASGWDTGWTQNPALPQSYAEATTPPLALDLIPPPLDEGALSILATVSQGYSYVSGSPVSVGLPDDSTWALPWAVLSSVLRQDAQSRDYRRADYAMNRLQSALGVLKTWPCVMQAWPGGIQQLASSLFNLDHWQPGWRNSAGNPQTVAIAGRNLVAVSPVPIGAWNIALDCIGNSPASVADRATPFSVSQDIVTALLDNAQHAACFKLAGAEFEGTMGNYRAFVTVAQAYAARDRAQAINWESLRSVTRLENAQVPYELAPVPEVEEA